ncbi:hypothetical protein FZEAL_6211 [Fusarium zealandicum]|uniref:DUF202 domain-containing protein n=1 Tax=Fusarium zealandicum TaxID=1053134 RepID=A0A8H4XK41_9HYPO|nr:hypothetical protein FZEAL_6211 [Fusarium zealandicum]
MPRSTTISRSGSEYSLQDLTIRGRNHQRVSHPPADSPPGTDRDQGPPEPRGEGSAVPPADDPGTTGPVGFWASHVSCQVDFSAARDHLGYLRTSMMMSMVGTTVGQLFTINHSSSHDTGLGYFAVGKPLAITCYAFSIGTILLGAIRSWRHQRTMLNGKALAGGFEIHCLGICSVLLLFVFFGFLLAIDVVKETPPQPAQVT